VEKVGTPLHEKEMNRKKKKQRKNLKESGKEKPAGGRGDISKENTGKELQASEKVERV